MKNYTKKYVVYILLHRHKISNVNISIKFIGIFDSLESVQKGINKAAQLPGFKETPNDFKIIKFLLDKTHWINGFARNIGPNNIPNDDKFNFEVNQISELGIETVFYLTHYFSFGDKTIDEDIRYIGIYSSQKKMQAAINNLCKKGGFKNYQADFYDGEAILNNNEWNEGFATCF